MVAVSFRCYYWLTLKKNMVSSEQIYPQALDVPTRSSPPTSLTGRSQLWIDMDNCSVGKDGRCCSPIQRIRKEQGSWYQLYNTFQEKKDKLKKMASEERIHGMTFTACHLPHMPVLSMHGLRASLFTLLRGALPGLNSDRSTNNSKLIF